MNKVLKYSILVVVLGLALYASVNIKPLDEIKKSKSDLTFNAASYASDFMANKIETLPAINASDFLGNISDELENYTEQKGKKLGISDEYNFIIEGEARIAAIEEEYITVLLEENQELRIATEFIFGNAIRDGSGMANINDYQNTMDFNSISVELNNIVRETVVPPFKKNAKIGDALYFKGAVTIDIADPQINGIKVIPLIIKFND
ncbi:DUF2291 family protein [Allomuricauda sp. CP2A]|mgnify:CR=1 FL=1|jgi:predicted lipoprotein|uniref:DUF2291 family protein n=1 Tax=Allomuricauda sp. CP2A TaxID=1848189 RepID=UPI0008298713|nr:DUF2291 family protein [Muricauda sp. CP2A]